MKQLLQLHALLITHPPPIDPDLLALNLITASSNLSNPTHSLLTFSLLPNPNLLLWNSLLKSLSQNSLFNQTLRHFNLLVRTRSPKFPDEFTFTSVLKACAGLFSPVDGEISHAHVLKLGVEANLFVRNSLVDMYFKFGRQSTARKLFDEMTMRDVVSYNTLIAGYSGCGQAGIAREIFDSMGERSFVSWSAMIAGYSKSGDLDAARELFERMPERNVVCWNAMIAGYAQNERFSEAVKVFRRMLQVEGMKPNEVTLVSVLSACANLGALGLGKWIHGYVERSSTRLGLFLGNALSDMYSKCGCIAEARKVFGEMPERDVISWSIIVTGTAMHGLWKEAIASFHKMLRQEMEKMIFYY